MVLQKKSIKYVYLILTALLFMLPHGVDAQKKKKKKKKSNTEVVTTPPKKSPKKTIKSLTKSSKEIDGLFTIYQDTITGSIQMVISEDQLEKEFIHFAQIADGVMDAGRINRGSYRGSKIFKLKKYFNKIEFVAQNTSFYFDPDKAISKAKNANISQGIMASLKIEAYDKNKGLYLVKANDLFLKETFLQIKPSLRPGTSPNSFKLGNLDKNKTKINSIKNYPNNIKVKVEYVYSKSSTLNNGSNAVTDGRNVSIKVIHNLIALPENDYKPRFDDPRVGYFINQVDDKTVSSSTPYRDLIQRWHLKKKEPNALISEPVEPITWWMENTTPIKWRETIKNAVLEWNKAFEKAGFKNAIVVKQQPDDAEWDAGDIRYNVLRWTASPRPPFGGYGPSMKNPRTGEIIGADIMLEYVMLTGSDFQSKIYETQNGYDNSAYTQEDVLNNHHCNLANGMLENLQFAKTSALAFGATKEELNTLQKEVITSVIIHEIGHTLGLNHNMKASQLYSPEQLADADFIKGKCLTASIMDYAIINVTNDRTKQGQYNDVTIGPYDVWAIQLGYKPFNTEEERQALLNESTKPEHIFGNDADDMRSSGKGIDPRVMIFDQSSDPIKYSINRIELSNKLMEKIKSKFTNEGESYHELRRVYYTLSGQKANAATVISRYIGGVYVDRAMVGQEGASQPYTPVSLEDQKRAMNALKTYVFAPNAFDAPNDLYNYLARQRRGFDYTQEDPKIHGQVLRYQKNILNHLLHPNTLQRISDSELYGNKYKLSTFMTDLNSIIFKSDIYGSINSFRQNLQLEYTNMLIDMLTGKRSNEYTHNAKSMLLYNLKAIRSMAAPSGNIASRAHKQHLRALIDNAVKEIK
ncbi:zinc-dependent metalloprotease [uncultured Algibacter sp.]|uniref:zinc-dependent metalloprotease n=1 Tax=uncultured Algibacter sp. TaxID=298659 RepID=UPI00261E3729|nr:zinc-dependent metalloprotease [uncultured Algibacter sp.]